MDMEGVRRSIIAALLFLTLVVLAAASSGGDGDAAAVDVEVEQRHPPADERYELITFKNKDGEEIRLLANQRSTTGFANRSGHWFYAIREGEGKRRRRRRLHLPGQQSVDNDNRSSSRGGSSRTEGLWDTLGVLVNTTGGAASDPAAAAAGDGDDERYVLVGLQTSGGDKIRLVAIADQRYVAVTGFAKGFSYAPRWSFRDGERYRLLPTLAGSSHGGSSPAEVVASSLLAAMMKDGSS